MSLTRKSLSAFGLEPAQIDQIIEGHTESISALQDELDKANADRDKYKAEADKVAGLEKELETAKKDAETAKKDGAKYEQLKSEYEQYKAEQEKKEANAVKEKVFAELLKDMKVSDKGIEMILKWQGVDGVDVDESGKITNAKDLRKSVKEDWSDYIATESEEGAKTPTPPSNTGGPKMTIEQIDAIEDTAERQKAMLANHELFGI